MYRRVDNMVGFLICFMKSTDNAARTLHITTIDYRLYEVLVNESWWHTSISIGETQTCPKIDWICPKPIFLRLL